MRYKFDLNITRILLYHNSMSGIHNNCVPKALYWSMYNKFKDDGYYIESRKLRLENKLLKDKIIELESRLNLHLTPSLPLVVNQDKSTNNKPNQVIFSRGSQINNRDSTVKPVEVRPVGMRPVEVRPVGMKPIINRCRATIRNGRQCKQCNNSNQAGGPILNGFCGYHSHRR